MPFRTIVSLVGSLEIGSFSMGEDMREMSSTIALVEDLFKEARLAKFRNSGELRLDPAGEVPLELFGL